MTLINSTSKLASETLVFNLFKDYGINYNIFRPGFIGSDSTTGYSNLNDFDNRLIVGCMKMGKMPSNNFALQMLPVDFVARIIV